MVKTAREGEPEVEAEDGTDVLPSQDKTLNR